MTLKKHSTQLCIQGTATLGKSPRHGLVDTKGIDLNFNSNLSSRKFVIN